MNLSLTLARTHLKNKLPWQTTRLKYLNTNVGTHKIFQTYFKLEEYFGSCQSLLVTFSWITWRSNLHHVVFVCFYKTRKPRILMVFFLQLRMLFLIFWITFCRIYFVDCKNIKPAEMIKSYNISEDLFSSGKKKIILIFSLSKTDITISIRQSWSSPREDLK